MKQGGANGVQVIGNIDPQKFKNLSIDIREKEVIITEERIAHIKERHPDDFQRYSKYLKEIIENPDYIIEDKKPNTAMVLKQIEEQGEYFRLALRLVTPADHPSYKNSILTFLKIREKEWNRLIKNKKVLYKSE